MVEPQIVVLAVAGSSPVGHPIPSWSSVFFLAGVIFRWFWGAQAIEDGFGGAGEVLAGLAGPKTDFETG